MKKKEFITPRLVEYPVSLEADLLVTSAVGNSSMVQAAGQENDGVYDFEEYPESGVEWFE